MYINSGGLNTVVVMVQDSKGNILFDQEEQWRIMEQLFLK